MHPFAVVRLLVAISLITTFATTIHALPSPSSGLDVDSESSKARSPLEFRGRAYKNFRRDREFSIDSRDILLNKASDLKRAQRFRAAQKKKRDVAVENMLPRGGSDVGTTEKSDSTPVTPTPSLV